MGIFESKGRISAKNVTLKRCVRGAYDLPEPQIIGGPKWVDQDRYYIEAKATVPAGDHELMLMLQTLLADRFKLVLHREQRARIMSLASSKPKDSEDYFLIDNS